MAAQSSSSSSASSTSQWRQCRWSVAGNSIYLTEGENYVQVLNFIFSMIFVSGFGNECWCAPSWQWQFGALALFLAWFNLVILLKDMPFTGIPINMLFNICLTFVGLVFLPVLLIISFALPFYMLFVRELSSEVCSILLCRCP